MNKRKLSMVLAVVLSVVMVLSACGSKDMTEGKTAEELLELAYQKNVELESYDMNLDMHMEMAPPDLDLVNMDMTGTMTIFNEPMKARMLMEMTMPGVEEAMAFEQYMEGSDDGLIIYQNMENEWYKMVIKDASLSEMMAMDPAENLKLFMDYLVKTEVVGEEKINNMETVKLELTASGDMYKELMAKNPALNMNAGMPMDINAVMDSIGDMTYTIWVDKATLDIVRYDMDLSENMKNMADAFAGMEGMPAEIAEVFKSIKLVMTMEISNQNKAKDFEIPAEALEAQEMAY